MKLFCKDCKWFDISGWCDKLAEKTNPLDSWACFVSKNNTSLLINRSVQQYSKSTSTTTMNVFFGRDKDGTLWMFKSKPNKGTEGYSVENIEEMVDVSDIFNLPEITWNDKQAKECIITITLK